MSAETRLGIRAYYEDTDASGVVYHASYLRWFERARTEWLRAQGYGQQILMEQHGIAFTLADLQIRFRLPARLDDEVEVRTAMVKLGRASLSFRQTLYGAGAEWLTEASVRIGCVACADFRPVALPAALWQSLNDKRLAI